VRLLLDTQILIWGASGDPRLRRSVREAFADPEAELFVSAVTVAEFNDLQARKRIRVDATLDDLAVSLAFQFLDFPAQAAQLLTLLPVLHRDPVDRMLVAHAIHADLTLVTADRTIRSYPVKSLW